MSAITISPKQFQATANRIIKQHKTKILRAMRTTAALSAGKVKEWVSKIKPFAPVDTGHYRASWKHGALPDGARLWTDSPYGGAIEYGYGPNKVPSPYSRGGPPSGSRRFRTLVAKSGTRIRVPARVTKTSNRPRPLPRLVEWARRKLRMGDLRNQSGKKRGAAFALAVVVQQNLHNRGHKGYHVLTHPSRQRVLVEMTVREIDKEMRKGTT